MEGEWTKTTIGEQITLQRGFDITKKEQRPGNIPVVSSGGVKSFHDTVTVKGPGVVLGRKGVVGSVYYIGEDFWPHDTTLWVKKFNGNNPRFVYYFFKWQAPLLASLDVGSANPTLNRNHVHPTQVLWPAEAEQKAIAHMLGSLDDKIELNRQMNETLESMAQALFKSWFVNFDPVIDNALASGKEIPEELRNKAQARAALGDKRQPLPAEIRTLFPDEFVYSDELGWIPLGWEVSSFGKEYVFLNGYAFKSKELVTEPESAFHVFKMGHIKRGGGFNYDGTKSYFPIEKSESLQRFLLKKGDVLMSMTDMKSSMALLGHTALMPIDDTFLLNQRVGRFRVKDEYRLNYPYLYIFTNLKETIEELRSRANSGVQVNLSTTEIKKTNILVPSNDIHHFFDKMTLSMFEKVSINLEKNRTLISVRDTLLPKLLSGEIRIPDAEKMVEGQAL